MKLIKQICTMTACTLMLGTFTCCTSGGDNVTTSSAASTTSAPPPESLPKNSTIVRGVDYTDVSYTLRDLSDWIEENSVNMENGPCTKDGVIRSPYFELTANGVEIPVFMAKTTYDPHSFACIEVESGDEIPEIAIDLSWSRVKVSATILPESADTECVLSDDRKSLDATIRGYGSFSFVFDGKRDRPLTLFVRQKMTAPEGEAIVLEPSEHETLSFDKEGATYILKKGVYKVEGLSIDASNITIFFESGTHVICTAAEPSAPFLKCYGKDNVKLIGNAIFDLAYRGQGGGSTIDFYDCRGLEYSGITVLNAASWTNCFTAIESLAISDVAVIGYRTYSDGIMLSDCKDATVRNCFVRTGDDAIEVKSTSDGKYRCGKVLFEGCAVWTDKGIGYGVVYEANNDVSDVTWRNCSVGFASSDWSRHLGALTVSIEGSRDEVSDYDLHFENIEIYKSNSAIISLWMVNGGNVHDVHFENITCKKFDLTNGSQDHPIELIISNPDSLPTERFSIDRFYFKNINIDGRPIDKDSIGCHFPADFVIPDSLINIE